jgi:hypothetical protein
LAALRRFWDISVSLSSLICGFSSNEDDDSGFSANLAVFNITSLAWRLQLAAACLPALPLMFLIYVCPGTISGFYHDSS